MPEITKTQVYYNIFFKNDVRYFPSRSADPVLVYKKGQSFLRKVSKENLKIFINNPIIENMGMGGKLLLNPIADFTFVEVTKVTSIITKEASINPENL